MAERARLRWGSRICDVGCGYGGPARFFASERGARVVGITLSREQARQARAATSAGMSVEYVLADWLENPCGDASFVAVVAIESVSHMTDKVAFLREARRVLAQGGRLVVAAWLAAEKPAEWQRRHLLRPICSEGRLPGLATASEYRRWMEVEGLHVEGVEDLSAGVRRTWSICARRVLGRMARDPASRKYLRDAGNSERVFALTIARIWAAYRVGALRYGLITAVAG